MGDSLLETTNKISAGESEGHCHVGTINNNIGDTNRDRLQYGSKAYKKYVK